MTGLFNDSTTSGAGKSMLSFSSGLHLQKQGYHLQMPPPDDEYIEHLPEELLRRNDPM